jgi:hypothetical protein
VAAPGLVATGRSLVLGPEGLTHNGLQATIGFTFTALVVGHAVRTLSFRAVLSCWLRVVLRGSLFAADSSAAMLYTNGPARLNGSNVPKTSAIFG